MEAVHREQSLWDPSALLSGSATGQEKKGVAEDEMVGWHHREQNKNITLDTADIK